MVDAQIRLRVIPVALQVSARSWSVQVLLFFPNRRGLWWNNSWRRGSSTTAPRAPEPGLSGSPSSPPARELPPPLPPAASGDRKAVAVAGLGLPTPPARTVFG